MWLTTSKNADRNIRLLAKKLALRLPGCFYASRGERALERIEELALRAGEEVILVLSEPDMLALAKSIKKKYEPTLVATLSKKQKASKSTSFAWQNEQMLIENLEFGAELPKFDLPLKLIEPKAAEDKKLAAFLAIEDEPLAKLYAEHATIEAKGGEIIADKNVCAKFIYRWGKLWQ